MFHLIFNFGINEQYFQKMNSTVGSFIKCDKTIRCFEKKENVDGKKIVPLYNGVETESLSEKLKRLTTT